MADLVAPQRGAVLEAAHHSAILTAILSSASQSEDLPHPRPSKSAPHSCGSLAPTFLTYHPPETFCLESHQRSARGVAGRGVATDRTTATPKEAPPLLARGDGKGGKDKEQFLTQTPSLLILEIRSCDCRHRSIDFPAELAQVFTNLS